MNDRIRKILEHYKLSASKLAEILNTQPSSISHILSGRNKPSVDLLEKIARNFNEINLTWLITGNEPMLNRQKSPSLNSELTAPPLPKEKELNNRNLFSETQTRESLNERTHNLRNDNALISNQVNDTSTNQNINNMKPDLDNRILNTMISNIDNNELDNNEANSNEINSGNNIDQIVIFYKDGSFKNYKPK